MLIEKTKYKIGDIVNLKLLSGDEVVGELVFKDNDIWELKNPCLVVTSPDGIGLIQAMFGLDPEYENLRYRDQHIVSMCRTHEKMKDHYIVVTTASTV